MKNIKHCIVFLCVFISSAAIGQEARDWLLKMNRALAQAKTCEMDFSMQYYASKKDARPQMSVSGKVAFGQGLYYSSFMGKTVMQNKDCSIVIDDNEKQIVYLPAVEKKDKSRQTPSLEYMLDSALLKTSALKQIGKTNTSVRLQIIPRSGIYESIEVLINTSTYAMEELVYIYKPLEEKGKSVKAVISYSSVRFNAGLDQSLFNEKKYLVKQNGKWKGAGSRAMYEVFDEKSK